jgi:hypothetical protein
MEGYRYPLVQLRHHMFHASGDLWSTERWLTDMTSYKSSSSMRKGTSSWKWSGHAYQWGQVMWLGHSGCRAKSCWGSQRGWGNHKGEEKIFHSIASLSSTKLLTSHYHPKLSAIPTCIPGFDHSTPRILPHDCPHFHGRLFHGLAEPAKRVWKVEVSTAVLHFFGGVSWYCITSCSINEAAQGFCCQTCIRVTVCKRGRTSLFAAWFVFVSLRNYTRLSPPSPCPFPLAFWQDPKCVRVSHTCVWLNWGWESACCPFSHKCSD